MPKQTPVSGERVESYYNTVEENKAAIEAIFKNKNVRLYEIEERPIIQKAVEEAFWGHYYIASHLYDLSEPDIFVVDMPGVCNAFAGFNDGLYAIVLTEDFVANSDYSDEFMRGVISHEVGHLSGLLAANAAQDLKNRASFLSVTMVAAIIALSLTTAAFPMIKTHTVDYTPPIGITTTQQPHHQTHPLNNDNISSLLLMGINVFGLYYMIGKPYLESRKALRKSEELADKAAAMVSPEINHVMAGYFSLSEKFSNATRKNTSGQPHLFTPFLTIAQNVFDLIAKKLATYPSAKERKEIYQQADPILDGAELLQMKEIHLHERRQCLQEEVRMGLCSSIPENVDYKSDAYRQERKAVLRETIALKKCLIAMEIDGIEHRPKRDPFNHVWFSVRCDMK